MEIYGRTYKDEKEWRRMRNNGEGTGRKNEEKEDEKREGKLSE